MILTEISSTPSEALPIATFKANLRLGTGFAEDDLQNDLLEIYLRAALSTIEGKTGVVIFKRLFALQITSWRSECEQGLPVRPVSAIQNITVFDSTGVSEVVDPTRYQLRNVAQRSFVQSVQGHFPNIVLGGTAEVVFEAGYGETIEELPKDLLQAVVLLASYFYENRSGGVTQTETLPMAVLSLIERFRPTRLGGKS